MDISIALILSMSITVIGLVMFEVVSSIDNAVINAEVLSTMSEKARKWFLVWGLLFAVFIVRGLLPFVIVWATNPSLGPIGALTATFSNDPHVIEAIETSKPPLLVGGGLFLVLLFFYWLFLEDKEYGLKAEAFFEKKAMWFYSVASMILVGIVWLALGKEGDVGKNMALGAVIGSTAFFITSGFKHSAEESEKKLMTNNTMSDVSKILYLEVIDTTFSIDGVLGAFAFTMSVPLIILGNGIGALVVRQMTIGNIERIKKYKYLKNGAMYSIFALGTIMILHSFHVDLPEWLSPVVTFVVIGYFFWKSVKENKELAKKE